MKANEKTLLVILAAAAALWYFNQPSQSSAADAPALEDQATLNGIALPRRRRGSAFKTA